MLVPERTSATKILQARVFGADVRRVPGTRDDVAHAAVDGPDGAFYAGHNWHPLFIEGMKLLAYEIWEDLGFEVPDAVLVPAGAGSLVLGCALGFEELRRIGEIDRLPRIIAAQPARCSPLAAAFERGATEVTDGSWEPTVAEGASIARPVRAREVLAAVRATGGAIAAVPEPAILPAVQELAARGLFVEPTAALVAAAVRPLLDSGRLVPSDRVVMVLTGSGLKASDDAGRSLATLLG